MSCAADDIPSPEELERTGAVIGEVFIDNQNIFDLEDPEENKQLYRLANKLHIRTQPKVIRQQLLFKSGDLSMDLVRRIVMVRGQEVKLTPREYDLLRLLVSHAGKVLTHKFILKEVWGGESDVQYLRIYIRTLRQKLEADPEQPSLILTEQGVGYRLRPAD